MLVPRGQMMSGGGGVGQVVDGFLIRRSASPISVGGSRLEHSLSDNKENIPPLGFNYRSKRSPLPEWYPRTPLRDITALVNALDRRRLRATAQQLNLGAESPPPPSGALPQESFVSGQTQDAENSSSDPDPPSLSPPPSAVVLHQSIVSDHTQGVDNTSHVPQPSSYPLPETMQVLSMDCSTIPTNATTDAAEQTDIGKLSVSIDEIEKALRSISKVPAKKTSARTRSLLSMR